jgi:hypothetical protein
MQYAKRVWPCRPDPQRQSGACRTSPLATLLVSGLLLALLAPAAWSNGAAAPAGDGKPAVAAIPAARHPREKSYMKRKWGVEIQFVRETAAGYMLEFRYKVLDPDKARALFIRNTKPVMTHVRTGTELIVPTPAKTGALRNSDVPLADHVYWMFFSNLGKIVQRGDEVNIQIGEFAVEGIVVQ